MTAAHTPTTTNDLARMRDRCRRAYLAAREGDVGAQVLADRRYAQVLSAIEGQPGCGSCGHAATGGRMVRDHCRHEKMTGPNPWPPVIGHRAVR